MAKPTPTRAAAAGAPPPPVEAAPTFDSVRSPRLRRSPLTYLLGIGLIVLSMVGILWAFMAVNTAHEVVAVRRDVPRGEVIKAEDLERVRVGVDPALHPIPATQLNSVVGKRAKADLTSGTLLASSAVSDKVELGEGRSMVGLNMPAGTMPAGALQPGDAVRIVSVAAGGAPQQPAVSGGKGSTTSIPPNEAIKGIVARTSSDASNPGITIVNVEVASTDAVSVAMASGGKIVLVLDSREH